MTKNRKDLKATSLALLALVVLDVILIIVNLCVDGLPKMTDIPADWTEGMIKASAIVSLILSFAVFIPQIYVSVKGIKIANGAASGRAHIIWAVILAIFAVASTISYISALTKVADATNALGLAGAALDVVLFALYFISARRVAAEG